MSNFDFSTLNSTDFEELVCDLLNVILSNKENGISFRTFKEGKDKGVDFLYSTVEKEYNIVGQAKHYYRSGYKALLDTVKKEVPKIKKLNPNKYILATSLDLSHQNMVEIKDGLEPYVRELNDIFAKKDLNRILDENPNLLDNHFKLWFSSTNVLKKILNYSIEGRSSEFLENSIKRRMRLFVKTDQYYAAYKKLQENRFIILTGEPGVGKTTLAELLIYDLINKDYQLCYIYDDIKEVEKILTEDDRKQIIYYDDFLGHTSYEITRSKGSEASLVSVLNRISYKKNKYLILTTRSFILNSAINESERLRRLNIKAKESIIKLNSYTLSLKVRLLKNHVEESELSDDHKEILNSKTIVEFITLHKNFSPRSVEFITLNENIQEISALNFESYIKENFNTPNEIWKHAYEQQIGDLERWFLNTMVCFGDSVSLIQIENAFLSRIEYEIKYNNFIRPNNPFNSTFKKVESGFVVFEYNDEGLEEEKCRHIKFINPSLVDFLRDSLKANKDEVIRMSESCYYLEQVLAIYPLIENPINLPSERLKLQILDESSKFIKLETSNKDSCLIALFTHLYFSDQHEFVVKQLGKINDWSFLQSENKYLSYFNSFLHKVYNPNIVNHLKSQLEDCIEEIFVNVNDFTTAFDLVELLIEKFNIDFTFGNGNNNIVSLRLEQLINDKIDEEVYWLVDFSQNENEWEEILTEMIKLKDKVKRLGFYIEADFTPFYEKDWQEIANYNYVKEQLEKDD